MAAKRTSRASDNWLGRLLGPLRRRRDPQMAAAARALGVRTAAFAALAVAAALGLRMLDRLVLAAPQDQAALRLNWLTLPAWLSHPSNGHIVAALSECSGLSASDRATDPTLARRVAERLSSPEAAWIARLDRVEVRPGEVAVSCAFRRPAAWVRVGGDCYLLGEDGVRLPGRYMAGEVTAAGLMTIVGAQGEAPPPGRAWDDRDVAAGLRVVSLCEGRAFGQQIAEVLVHNHGGRIDRGRPQLELATDRPGARIWWGRPPGEEQGMEILAEQKAALLESLYQRSGRVDLDRSYVDVTTWPDRVLLPATPVSMAGQASRGR